MAAMPLRAMGRRGREWIARDFSWAERAREMIDLYEGQLPSSRAGRS
jgi:glycosyltransferase involved in cell wall biosynthesis